MRNNQLLSIVERIEKIEDERSLLASDVKDILQESKSSGFDPKIIKKVIALRKKNAQQIEEEQALLATYMSALGMLADTPLGQAALKAVRE